MPVLVPSTHPTLVVKDPQQRRRWRVPAGAALALGCKLKPYLECEWFAAAPGRLPGSLTARTCQTCYQSILMWRMAQIQGLHFMMVMLDPAMAAMKVKNKPPARKQK